MNLKSIMLDGESKKGNQFYIKMLTLLDNPKRLKYNNPEKLLQASGISPGQTVLEIGCGSGFFTIPASKMLGDTGKLYSIDIHDTAIKETQRKVDEFSLKNVVVKKDDAMKSSFEDSMFDLVLLYGVVPAPVISMKDISIEIKRLLKPNGIYAIWTMVPFWSPSDAIKYAHFKEMEKINNVFCLRKI